MKDKVKRTERGWAGHFICGNDCRFRRNTLLEYGDKRVVVSTVGNLLYINPITKKGEITTIGLNRYYETMAFEATFENDFYWEADIGNAI